MTTRSAQPDLTGAVVFAKIATTGVFGVACGAMIGSGYANVASMTDLQWFGASLIGAGVLGFVGAIAASLNIAGNGGTLPEPAAARAYFAETRAPAVARERMEELTVPAYVSDPTVDNPYPTFTRLRLRMKPEEAIRVARVWRLQNPERQIMIRESSDRLRFGLTAVMSDPSVTRTQATAFQTWLLSATIKERDTNQRYLLAYKESKAHNAATIVTPRGKAVIYHISYCALPGEPDWARRTPPLPQPAGISVGNLRKRGEN